MEQNDLISRSDCAKTKTKTHFARIVVGGTAEKPYYNILYFDPDDKKYHIGFGSFRLEYVFRYLLEEFEIVDAPSVEAEPVRHGRWIEKPYLLGTSRFCSLCGSNYGMPHEVYNFCPNCGAKMDLEENHGKTEKGK